MRIVSMTQWLDDAMIQSLQRDLPNPPLPAAIRAEINCSAIGIPDRPIILTDIARDALGLRVRLGQIQYPDVKVVSFVVVIDTPIGRESDSPAEAIPACVVVVEFGRIGEIRRPRAAIAD